VSTVSGRLVARLLESSLQLCSQDLDDSGLSSLRSNSRQTDSSSISPGSYHARLPSRGWWPRQFGWRGPAVSRPSSCARQRPMELWQRQRSFESALSINRTSQHGSNAARYRRSCDKGSPISASSSRHGARRPLLHALPPPPAGGDLALDGSNSVRLSPLPSVAAFLLADESTSRRELNGLEPARHWPANAYPTPRRHCHEGW